MPHTPSPVDGFRKPWTQGARGYHEADTFDAAREGFKRKRSLVMFHMPNTGEAGDVECVTCGKLLREPADAEGGGFTRSGDLTPKPDKWSTWHYTPVGKLIVGGQHYACSWSTLFHRLIELRSF